MFVNFGQQSVQYLLPYLKGLRQRGVATELYPDETKIKKQFSYAHARNIPFVAIAGEDEIANHQILIKEMASGNQYAVAKDNFIDYMLSLL
jgi:histidyl-tRNA synthetase